ncbi:hypothetical protein jhhlp_005306 [Lomentospora prolificans]|uniref:Uncharacterized protein n=1 Tax=Lomentospora prolificans TaxID=41688 RepID=A0A2N3N7K4_9PEZI|nr:hypothetical protein jhhlp_005306 [Lomentospora prolificans]
MVTADGELVTALRDTGDANFGVMVKMKVKVRKLQNKDVSLVTGRSQWFPNSVCPESKFSTDVIDNTIHAFIRLSGPPR